MDPTSTSSGSDSRDPPEAPRPDPLRATAPKGKHKLFTHFPKYPNCELCKRTKITREACRRNSQSHTPRATNFGEIIAADHKVLNEEEESRNNQRYAILVQDFATQRCFIVKLLNCSLLLSLGSVIEGQEGMSVEDTPQKTPPVPRRKVSCNWMWSRPQVGGAPVSGYEKDVILLGQMQKFGSGKSTIHN